MLLGPIDVWHYIVACVFIFCATAVIIVTLLTHQVIPETIVAPGILFISGIISYIYGARKNGGSGPDPGPPKPT